MPMTLALRHLTSASTSMPSLGMRSVTLSPGCSDAVSPSQSSILMPVSDMSRTVHGRLRMLLDHTNPSIRRRRLRAADRRFACVRVSGETVLELCLAWSRRPMASSGRALAVSANGLRCQNAPGSKLTKTGVASAVSVQLTLRTRRNRPVYRAYTYRVPWRRRSERFGSVMPMRSVSFLERILRRALVYVRDAATARLSDLLRRVIATLRQHLAIASSGGMTRVGIRCAAIPLLATLCSAAFFVASLTATVRLAERLATADTITADTITVDASVAIIIASMPSLSIPATHKHCPRSGSRRALPACASTFSAAYHAVVARGWTPPLLVASKRTRPSDEASFAQCRGTPPDRPPRFAA